MNRIAFIVEGAVTEGQVIQSMQKTFFDGETEFETIVLPATTNIYSIWKRMEKDDWETNLIDVIKEYCRKSNLKQERKNYIEALNEDSFSEIYLFFDYDGHANDIPDKNPHPIIEKMLERFNNETESGKLYISYPMAEALRDFSSLSVVGDPVFMDIMDGAQYKRLVGERAFCKDFRKLDERLWKILIFGFMKKIAYLFEQEGLLFHEYRKISSKDVYNKQYKRFIVSDKKVLVLSGFPEFLLDYYDENFWQSIKKVFLHKIGNKSQPLA